jgi:hypothetical protein
VQVGQDPSAPELAAPELAAAQLADANRLSALGRFEEALGVLKALWARVPGTPALGFALSLALLRLGAFDEGLALYEKRLEEAEFAPQRRLAPEKRWRGRHRDGDTILLVAEQGMGDMIQFARYATLVAARGLRVILHTPPALFRLFQTLPGMHALALTSAKLPAFDWQCPIVSTPLALGTRPETIPADVPYLFADPAAVAAVRQRLAGCPRPHVGLVWAAAEENPLLRHRSIPIAQVAAFVARSRATFVSLQVGRRAGEIAALRPHGVLDLGPHLRDFADTAAAIAALDLVITVDTATAHLAGALAHPVWTLLSLPSDWRWFVGRSDSPWYPSMRLFRQAAPGDWASVLDDVARALRSGIRARD